MNRDSPLYAREKELQQQQQQEQSPKEETKPPQPTSTTFQWRPMFKPKSPPEKIENFNKENREISADTELFDGMRIEFTKAPTKEIGVTHMLEFGSNRPDRPPSYSYSAQFFHPWSGMFLSGHVNTDPTVQLRSFIPISQHLSGLVQGLCAAKEENSAGILELIYTDPYRRGDLKYSFPNHVYEMSFAQHVTPGFCMGVHGIYSHKQAFSGLTYAARYKRNQWIYTCMGGATGWTMTASRNVKPQKKLRMTTDFTLRPSQEGVESEWGIGCAYNFFNLPTQNEMYLGPEELESSRFGSFKGRIDSNGRVAAVLEEKMAANMEFTISAELDHIKKQYTFGVGFTANF